MSQLLLSLGFHKYDQIFPVPLFCDNTGAVSAVQSSLAAGYLSPKLRHMRIRQRYAQELHSEGIICVQHVESAQNLADIGTKFLFNPLFTQMRNKLLVDAGVFKFDS